MPFSFNLIIRNSMKKSGLRISLQMLITTGDYPKRDNKSLDLRASCVDL